MKIRTLLFTALAVAVPAFALILGGGSMGCGGGSSSSSSDSGVEASAASYALPNEISAIPTSASAAASVSAPRSFSSAIKSLVKAATDDGTDYSNAVTETYIEERALEQFDILETVMGAVEQTNYTSEIGNGPYTAKVTFEEKKGKGSVEVDTKAVQTWICRADWIDADGNEVADQALATGGLRLRAWIQEDAEEGIRTIRAQIVITTPAAKNADGSYSNYGEWIMNVKFSDDGNDYFAASSSMSGDDNIIMVHEKFVENFPGGDLSAIEDKTVETKGIMHRSAESGYGRVSYPSFEAMFNPDTADTLTAIPIMEAAYAYNANHLAVRGGDGDAVFKDRNEKIAMTHRYGVFNKDTGENLTKSKSFGFPVRYEVDGKRRHGYYGAWQGRHQLWADIDETPPEGTSVTRDDQMEGQEESYVVGPTFNGTLARRSYIDADLSDIENIPVEIWVDQNFQLFYTDCDGDAESEWCECGAMDWENFGQCMPGQLAESSFNLESLVVGEKDTKKDVWINGFNEGEMQDKQFVYISGVGFFEAEQVEGGFGISFRPDLDAPLNPDDVPFLSVNIGGNLYVEYKGADVGFVEKELISFDTMTWTPTFNDDGDKPYVLPENRELYINMEGANYIVTKSGDDYTVKLELQDVANPVNAATFVPAGTVFRNKWDQGDSGSTYEFDPDSLLLVYKTIGDNDKDSEGNPNEDVEIGSVVATSAWGLTASIDGEDTDFNWEYSSGGGWGSVTYLKNTDGSYKILDNPVLFNSIIVANGAGVSKTLSLKFDGWMQGLPEMYQELEKNGWVITTDIRDKIINIPAGTELAAAADGTEYLIKPLEQGQFLVSVSDPGTITLAEADALDLSAVPAFTDHGMGDTPSDAPLYYSEGECVAADHCGEAAQ